MRESNKVRKVTTAIAVFVVSMSLPAIAAAGDSRLQGKSEKVSFADLKLKKEADARRLYRRLRAASERVCGVEPLSTAGSLANMSAAKRCFRDAMDSAVAEINDPTLTEIHRG